MKYELLIAVFFLYQLSICVFTRRWVNVRQTALLRIVEDRRLHSGRDQSVMTHARWRQKGVLALAVFMLGILLASFLGTASTIEEFSWSWFMVGVALVLAGGLAPWALVVEAYGIALVFDDHSITRLSPWSKERTIKWSEVESVTYSWFWAWYTLRSPEGSIHVTSVIEGLGKFAQVVVAQVPRNRISSMHYVRRGLEGPFRF